MRKKTTRTLKKHTSRSSWNSPIDIRLFPFLGFGHIKGFAKVFLLIEMVSSFLVVLGTFLFVFLYFFWK